MTEYTREEILNMEAGAELSALVQEVVMGESLDIPKGYKGVTVLWGDGRETIVPKPYSEDISAAWEVVDKMREQGFYAEIRLIGNSVSCIFRNSMGGIVEDVHDCETAPLAISRAAPLAVMGE